MRNQEKHGLNDSEIVSFSSVNISHKLQTL